MGNDVLTAGSKRESQMYQLKYAYASDVGVVRPTNQDAIFAVADIVNCCSCGLFCIADGMGGLSEGEYAASVAVQAMENWWATKLKSLLATSQHNQLHRNIIYAEFASVFDAVNKTLAQRAAEINSRIGTTCSVLLILNNTYYIAHSGDTRIYANQKRFLGNSQFTNLTVDHTWAVDHVGKLSDAEIRSHPKRNRLTSCLGVFDSPRIFNATGNIYKSCVFLLCTDGLYRVIDKKALSKMITKQDNLEILTNEMINMSVAQGTTDNISVIVVRFEKE